MDNVSPEEEVVLLKGYLAAIAIGDYLSMPLQEWAHNCLDWASDEQLLLMVEQSKDMFAVVKARVKEGASEAIPDHD